MHCVSNRNMWCYVKETAFIFGSNNDKHFKFQQNCFIYWKSYKNHVRDALKLLSTMNLLWLLVCGFLAVSAFPTAENNNRQNGENGWYVPQLDGSFVWMERQTAEVALNDLQKQTKFLFNNVDFYLYTRANKRKPQVISMADKSIDASNFDAAKPTRIVIHGWIQNYLFPMNINIRDAWLGVGEYNIIVVNWDRAQDPNYIAAVAAVPSVGERISKFIDYLVIEKGVSLDTLHVIGHSLGAHVAGYVGKHIKSGQIFTIIGLDPAQPFFSADSPETRLNETDAYYVEAIHTNAGVLGFLKPIGKSDFYPNGGSSQPGCFLLDFLGGVCSHNRVSDYYAEAVKMDNFLAIRCESYEAAVGGKCGSTYSSVRMAAKTNAYVVKGEYYVPIKQRPPYGMLTKSQIL
uniref:Lipase domain-containing protein n=2 Tax=Nemorhina TaxID=44051 RepID=A0A1B0BK99_9MUSC